jgi:hypothetical protein
VEEVDAVVVAVEEVVVAVEGRGRMLSWHS